MVGDALELTFHAPSVCGIAESSPRAKRRISQIADLRVHEQPFLRALDVEQLPKPFDQQALPVGCFQRELPPNYVRPRAVVRWPGLLAAQHPGLSMPGHHEQRLQRRCLDLDRQIGRVLYGAPTTRGRVDVSIHCWGDLQRVF